MPGLMTALDRHFDLRALQHDPDAAHQRLWSCSRVTAWRFVKGASESRRLWSPRLSRAAFVMVLASPTLQASVPLNLVQRSMGHERLSSTAIYTSVCGNEETAFAARFWDAD
jgi:integrase/recombinase XerD